MEKELLEQKYNVKMSDSFYDGLMSETKRKQEHLISLGYAYVSDEKYFDKLAEDQFRAKCMSLYSIAASTVIMAERMEKEHPEKPKCPQQHFHSTPITA